MKIIIMFFMSFLICQVSFAKNEHSGKHSAKSKITTAKKSVKKDSKRKTTKKKDSVKKIADKKSKKGKKEVATKKSSKKNIAKKSSVKNAKVAKKPSKGKLEAMKYMAASKKAKSKAVSIKKSEIKKLPERDLAPIEVVETPMVPHDEPVILPQENPIPEVTDAGPTDSVPTRGVANEVDEFKSFDLETSSEASDMARPNIIPEE